MPSCANKVVKAMWQSNTSTLPLRRYQKSAVGMSSLAPVGWITPAGVSNGPRKVPLIDSSMLTTSPFPVIVGKELGQKGDQTAQLRTTQARLALHTADAVEYTVLCEQIPEPLGVQGITLPVVVRAQDDREVGLLTLGQVAVGERQLGQVARAQACADLRALDESRSLRRRGADSKSQARGRGQGGDRLPAMNLHVHVLLWFSESDGIDARSPDEVTHQRDGGRRRADDVDATVKVEDHGLGLVARDRDLDAADAANLHGLLLDIGGHRDLRHQRVERSSHRRDIGSRVEPALTQDGIQLALLLFAHQQTSPQASTPLRLAHDRRDLGEPSSPEAGDSPPGVALNWRLARPHPVPGGGEHPDDAGSAGRRGEAACRSSPASSAAGIRSTTTLSACSA